MNHWSIRMDRYARQIIACDRLADAWRPSGISTRSALTSTAQRAGLSPQNRDLRARKANGRQVWRRVAPIASAARLMRTQSRSSAADFSSLTIAITRIAPPGRAPITLTSPCVFATALDC